MGRGILSNKFYLFIRSYPLTSFFVITFFLVWSGMAANVAGIFPALGEQPVMLDGQVVAVFRTRLTLMNWSPNIAAVIVLGTIGGWEAVRNLFIRFFKWRAGIGIWAMAVLLPFITASLAVVFYGLAGGCIDLSRIKLIPAVLCIRFIFALSAEGVGGEAGWRGLAQDHLQQKYSPLTAAIIVGIFWGLCHLPVLTIRRFDITEMICFMSIIVGLSVVLAWFYNRSLGSLLVVAVVHSLFDTFDAAYSRTFTAMLLRKSFMLTFAGVLLTSAAIIILTTKGRLGFVPVQKDIT